MDKESLGDFKILRKIGQGPLGSSYLGEHKFIKRRFILKVLPKELCDDVAFIERFDLEVRKIATLEHMNLAKLHNISVSDGYRYVVSDYITDGHGESKNISQYLGSLPDRLTEDAVLSILRQVAYALDYIHSKTFDGHTMAHGSLKLNNILVGKLNGTIPHIFISDVGLQSVVGQGRVLTKMYAMVAESLDIDLGVTGVENERMYASQEIEVGKVSKLHRAFLQNYAFLAPEQKLGGNPERVGPKADVYAFGVLAYLLLMGHLPEGYFPMPSKSDIGLSYNWDLVIQATMRQNLHDRPDSLVAMMDQLKARELEDVAPVIEKVHEKSERVSRSAVKPSDDTGNGISGSVTSMSSGRTICSIEEQLTRTGVTPRVTPIKRPMPTESVQEEGAVATLKEVKPVIRESELNKLKYDEDPGAIFLKETTVAPYKPQSAEIANVEPILSEMIVVSGGEYFRGSSIGPRDEKPCHKVTIENFAIDIHPVTNEQFLRFLEVMGGEKDVNNNDMIHLKDSRINRIGGKLTAETGYSKHPVVGVSWYGSQAYAKWIGKRLPTEVEWEIAAGGGKQLNVYPFGSEIERSQANFFNSDTTPVKSYPPNEVGLFDMAGNVYEWCEDWYSYNYYEISSHEPISPPGPQQGVYRVLRGGCWKSLEEDLRCSHRHRNNPGTMNKTYGFRLATDVE